MGMPIGGNKGSMSEPNIVPLIDVLLVLIIIFMVITPLFPQGMTALVPQPAPPDAKENPALLVVQVAAGGRVMINQDETNWDQLGSRLDNIFKLRADKVAFVKGDDSVDFGQVVRAIDIMRGAGIDSVGLITAKVEAGQ
jgi:biopolymer transport protein TolR